MLTRLRDLYEELKRDGVIFCFSGPTSQSVVEGLGAALKRNMELEEASMSTVQRVFSIFVEQMQNIVNYSAEKTPAGTDNGDELRHGMVVVGRSRDRFYVICGNRVRAAQSEKILERMGHLKRLNKEGLKAHYKRMRRRESDRESMGAGLGFIEMFRRASEPPEYHVSPIDADTVFFSIKAMG